MKVLVAGGAGYVGSVLVRALLARGHAVRVYDRLFFGKAALAGIEEVIELRVGDIRRVSEADVEGVDAVVNLSGISSDPTAEFRPDLTLSMNVDGALRLAEVCKKVAVRRYILASSCSVYDSSTVSDLGDVLLDETSRVQPVSAYGRSKVEAEIGLLALADREFSPVFLRKGTVYGPSNRMRFDLVINTLVKDMVCRGVMTLRAGGEVWRPIVEVGDAANAYVACLEAEEELVRGQIFNVVYRNIRVSEMALRIRYALTEMGLNGDVDADYRQQPVRSYRVSGAKLGNILGSRPSVSIERAAKQTARLIKEQSFGDVNGPQYYNVPWFERLEREHSQVGASGSPFDC